MTTLLTEDALAKRWGVTTRTLRALKARNEAPPVCEVVGKPRYRLEDIEAHEEAKTRGGAVPPEARRAMKRAADLLGVVAGWKTASPAARALAKSVRDDLVALTKTKEQ